MTVFSQFTGQINGIAKKILIINIQGFSKIDVGAHLYTPQWCFLTEK
jgi:hypothetical protein